MPGVKIIVPNLFGPRGNKERGRENIRTETATGRALAGGFTQPLPGRRLRCPRRQKDRSFVSRKRRELQAVSGREKTENSRSGKASGQTRKCRRTRRPRELGFQHNVREEGYSQYESYQQRHAQYVHQAFFFVRFEIKHSIPILHYSPPCCKVLLNMSVNFVRVLER